MHLGIYTYITLFNVIYIYYPPPLFLIISYAKPSFKPKKDVRLTWGVRGGRKDNHLGHLVKMYFI